MPKREEKLYKEKCVGCPHEKECNEDCDYCDDYLEELDMMEEDL